MGAEGRSVLVADENAEFRTAVFRRLQRSGMTVECAPGGRQAMDRLARGGIGLVLAAAEMTDIAPLELVRAARSRPLPVPVILMSARGSVSAAVEAVKAGAWDYLVPPLAPETVEIAVRNALSAAGEPPAGSRAPEHRSGRKVFITHDPPLLEMLETARRVARSTASVLIQGESGTGKELLAAFIHRHSLHPEAPYVAVNCAALPESLAESELFGHEKGAFTGALMRKIGKFELAKKGTLVLDEIGEMPLPLQAKLLRALQEREIDRVGGGMPVAVEARVVAITNRDLSLAVASGRFREDLFFRIHVVPISIPPLRERPGDIRLLADHFLAQFNAQTGKAVRCFSDEALAMLGRHEWKGNVRELENRVERGVLLAEGDTIHPRHLGLEPRREGRTAAGPAAVFRPGTTVWEMERQLIMGTLSNVNQNRTRAAELLGISIRTLRNKLREYRSETEPAGAVRSA